jgi:hypothetical protein
MLMKMSSPMQTLPAVDEHIVVSESGYEIDDGKLVRVAPADEPHADRHSKIAALLEAHVADDFNVAVDMLTRTSEIDDIAPDVSVYPCARHPQTAGRQLEHLAFQVMSTESRGHAANRAAKLAGRGVRRVFAIDPVRHRAYEWSTALADWTLLALDVVIEDVTLAVALPIDALVRAAKADDAVARALLAKQNPVLVAAVTEARDEGRVEGKAEAKIAFIVRVLAERGLQPTVEEQRRLHEERDLAKLDRWFDAAFVSSSVAEVLAQ